MVSLPMKDALPESTCVNSFMFRVDTPDTASWDAINTWMAEFYDGLVAFLSKDIDWPNAQVKLYDHLLPPPNYPIRTDTLVTTPSDQPTKTLPHELAVCLSFQGRKISGLAQNRRRGRVYLGPFDQSVVPGTQEVILSTVVDAIAARGDALMAHSVTIPTVAEWIVYSGVAEVEDAIAPVREVWCDNAWDIQRRRGTRPTTRKTYTIPPPT